MGKKSKKKPAKPDNDTTEPSVETSEANDQTAQPNNRTRVSQRPRTGTMKKMRDWIMAVAVIAVSVIGVIAYFTNNLPTTKRIISAVEVTGKKLVDDNKKWVIKLIEEGTQKILLTLVSHRADEVRTRNDVYRDALEQTAGQRNAYVCKIDPADVNSYVIVKNWCNAREGDVTDLLTDREEVLIKDCFEKHPQEDLLTLMYLALTDSNIIEELEREGAYDVEYYKPKLDGIVPGKKTPALKKDEEILKFKNARWVGKKAVLPLTPYEKAAIIGGYIGELKLKHRKIDLKNQRSSAKSILMSMPPKGQKWSF